MAYRALHNGRPVRPFDLDIEERPFDLACIECTGEMHIVKEHSREGTSGVSRHFQHNNKSCGRGGGGEADIHKRRKEDALSKALREMDELGYEVAKYGVEGSDAYPVEYIGDHRPDSFLEFEDTHWRYGDGLSIEYQHKNEDKDRDAVSEAYANEFYTTVWLWEDQFADSEIDLFGGEVVVPWPKHVPSPGNWRESFRERFAEKWEKAAMSGLVTAGASATLPPEWHDEKAQEIWREQNWEDLFSDTIGAICTFDQEWGLPLHLVLDGYEIDATLHINKWLLDDQQYYKRWTWNDPTRYKRFDVEESENWKEYGPPLIPKPLYENMPSRSDESEQNRTRELPRLVNISTTCPNCGVLEKHDPIGKGEITRSTTCGNCGEWYTVEDRRNRA